jgi:hypothetical protein
MFSWLTYVEEHVPSSEGIQKPMNSGGSVQKPTKSCIVLPTGCNMTSEQRAQVITLEQKTQPELPFYITAMHRRSVASGILVSKFVYDTLDLCIMFGS